MRCAGASREHRATGRRKARQLTGLLQISNFELSNYLAPRAHRPSCGEFLFSSGWGLLGCLVSRCLEVSLRASRCCWVLLVCVCVCGVPCEHLNGWGLGEGSYEGLGVGCVSRYRRNISKYVMDRIGLDFRMTCDFGLFDLLRGKPAIGPQDIE